MGWLSGWDYRKSHNINGSDGAGVNYQIRIKVHYGSGEDSGEDVYTSSHCKTDFGDIRFTDDDGTTELDYWMEKKVDSDYAIFWVEVKDDLGSNQSIYVYYGKSDATTTSNFGNTFIDVDDFEDGTVGQVPSGWTEEEGILTRVSDDSDYVKHGSKGLKCASDVVGGDSYRSITTIDVDNSRAIEFWVKVVVEESNYYQYINLEDAGGTDIITISMRYKSPDRQICYASVGWEVLQDFSVGIWYHIKIYNIDFTNNQCDIDIDGINKGTNCGFNNAGSSLVKFEKKSGGHSIWREAIDTLFIRKCIPTEPSHGAWGNEEEGIIIKEVTDSLTLSDAVNVNKDLVGVSDSFGLADNVLRHKPLVEVSNGLSLGDAVLVDKVLTIEDVLSLSDEVDVSVEEIIKEVTDSLSLQDIISVGKNVYVTDTLTLADLVVRLGEVLLNKTKLDKTKLDKAKVDK